LRTFQVAPRADASATYICYTAAFKLIEDHIGFDI